MPQTHCSVYSTPAGLSVPTPALHEDQKIFLSLPYNSRLHDLDTTTNSMPITTFSPTGRKLDLLAPPTLLHISYFHLPSFTGYIITSTF